VATILMIFLRDNWPNFKLSCHCQLFQCDK